MRKFFTGKILLVLFSLFLSPGLKATHNRAGEITYIQKSDLTYEITITTFTYTLSFADREFLDVEWGDNTISTAKRSEEVILPAFYKRNVYKIDHTYPGPGIYRIVVQDPNRNQGVKNIPNSVNVVFSISTTLYVNPAIGRNNTPVLLNPPYDKAAFGHVFIHNPAAYDPDGDSLSYALTKCTREDGKPIENYTFPPATDTVVVDPITGDLIWNTPADTGKYNVAIEIKEWRNGVVIGMVIRDMQIDVYSTDNKPPVNTGLSDYCVEVGNTVSFNFSATDADGDSIVLRSSSGIYTLADCRAIFSPIDSVPGRSSALFTWTPCHQAVRNQPYNVIFKSEDNSEIELADIDNMNIKVLGPSPVLDSAIAEGKSIRLSWDDYGTTFIAGFSIYRREGSGDFTIDECTAGVPPGSGYVKVGYIAGSSSLSFVDSNNGAGLQYGREYSYRIVAVYPNGTESKPSNEVRSSLISGVPVITKVSVSTTSASNGAISLAWLTPPDSVPGPYRYRINRAPGISGNQYQQIAEQTDTTLVDSLINTSTSGYIYRIDLISNTTNEQIGEPSFSSSLFLTASAGDRKSRFVIGRNVPWINSRYDFFRFNNATATWDSVGTTTELEFTDPGLVNGQEYCYYVRSTGNYPSATLPQNLVNLSQRICVTPVDNEPPCVPVFTISSQCDSLYNTIRWSVPDQICLDDIAGYRVYYKPTNEETLNLLIDIRDPNTLFYRHSPGEVIAACYAISAYDELGNESQQSAMVCIDTCDFYEIPNVFTPNGDDINDRLVAKTSGLVEKVDFKLFNRNGLLVFSTDNPRLEWDGVYNGKIVSPGVYFYSCDVFERRVDGIEQFHLSGFVHVITEKDAEIRQDLAK